MTGGSQLETLPATGWLLTASGGFLNEDLGGGLMLLDGLKLSASMMRHLSEQ